MQCLNLFATACSSGISDSRVEISEYIAMVRRSVVRRSGSASRGPAAGSDFWPEQGFGLNMPKFGTI